MTCTVPASYFIFNTAELIDAAKTKQDLTPCITAALAAHATFALDGWTSYEGPLNASGKPAIDDPENRTLSDERVQAIANLLVNDLGVSASAITRTDRARQHRPARPRPAQPRQPGRGHHLHHQVINQAKEASAMSMANVTIGHTGPEEHWEPALTPKEAAKIGIPKNEYESAALYARMAVEEHQHLGTLRDHWEPTPIQNGNLAAPFITDGEQELASRLEKEADPPLDKSQGLIENVKANLDEITEDTQPIAAPESGANYSVAEAVERVGQHDKTIERDEAAGKHHHRRASVLLQRLATSAPWVEAVGFLTFVTYYLNVPLLQPWLDWLGWSFAATVVTVIILGQTWLVRHAARSHNHAREASADGHRHEAERGFTRRNWYLGLTAVTAVAITSGMIWRGVAALGDASIGTTAVMVFVAAVTGLLLPTLAYLGIALDGSTDLPRARQPRGRPGR